MTNNFSPKHLEYIKKIKREKININMLRISVLIAFILIWELSAQLKLIEAFLFSSPSRIFKTLVDLIVTNVIWEHMAVSTFETIAGFTISTVLGTLIAVIMWWSPRVNRVCEPYIVILNSLPKIALGPIIIVWMGTGMSAIITMAVLISIVITTINMLTGFNETNQNKILLMQTMQASKAQIFTKLVLPSNIVTLVSTLKINVGLAWVGTIMGEYLVSRAGLGYLIIYGGQVFKLDLVMTCTIVLCILAALMYFIVAAIEKKLIKYN